MRLEAEEVNIVIRGNFNPAIFHPAWFSAQGLIRQQEAEAAKLEIVHPSVAKFVAEWLDVSVTDDFFKVATTQEPFYEPLRDLVIGVFEILSHTPLKLLGINSHFNYQLDSVEVWNRVGHRLAPKQDWEELLKKPGLRSLLIEGERTDDYQGYVRVKVEPIDQILNGVRVEINDHYVLSESQNLIGSTEMIKVLSNKWESSLQLGKKIADSIASLGLKP